MNNNQEEKEKMKVFTQERLPSFSKEVGSLIPLLQKTQETIGYLPREAMEKVAALS